jgi:transposase
MMKITYGHASYAECEAERLRFSLSARLFGADRWASIKTWFATTVQASHWMSAPFREMTAQEAVPGYPRWKQISVDVLSWLIFCVLVPSGHRLVQLWRTVDWAAINCLCALCYQNSRFGQRAWAPAQMFALLVLFFVLPISSESELLRTVAIVPLYRWFCGFGIFSPLPDHSTLYTFRTRVGVERFEAILTWVVQRCLELGLVANQLAYFDMTAVAASAYSWTPHERAVLLAQALIRYLELVEQGKVPQEPLSEVLRQLAAEVAIEVLGNKRLKQDPEAPQRVMRSIERWTRRRQEAQGQTLWEMALEEAVQTLLEESASLLPHEPQARRCWLKDVARQLLARLPHARGDGDAKVRRVNGSRLVCGYWLGFLVDSLQHVITAVRVVPLNVVQRIEMLLALKAHRERLQAYPKEVAADSAQDYDPVHQTLERHQIQGHIASREHPARGSELGSAHFTFDQQGQLLCPMGGIMQPGPPRQDGLTCFTAEGCASCRRKSECLTKKQQPHGPRVIHLNPAAHQRWLKNREHTRSEDYKQKQKRRFTSEGLFGLAKRLHGAAKMPYRSTRCNQIAGLMIGVVMNLSSLARQGKTLDSATA